MMWQRIKAAFLRRREEPVEAIQAREIARRIGERADALNDQLQKYNRARDPFAALMADLYNRDQLTRLHRSTEN